MEKPKKSAMEKAMRLLSRRALSERELLNKLCAAGYPFREARDAVAECRKRGYVNDEAFAADYTELLAGRELHLTPMEYKLLCLLARNVDKVLTHQFILREVWDTTSKSDLASLRVIMGTLRKKIEEDPAHPRYIQTHVGVGYRMLRV